ncbi:MAG: biotin--[Thermoguttaceae bacterium]|nr:biotin--[acetyl-CoA-carboxylase] ligase [Thermoguttaceae bacterium]
MESNKTLLDYLEARRGEFCSGEELADALGITRAAVWKRIKALEAKGLLISAIPNRGYMLRRETDVTSVEGISKYLHGAATSLRLEVVDETGSTNLDLRERGERGEPGSLALIARRQTAGRGRRGRRFFSPDSGVYLSLLLRPEETPATRATRYTTVAGLAVCEAIEATSDAPARIKWVNDVLVRGRKVCGIMTEAQVGLENGMLGYAVVGIGVNLYRPQGGYPEELRGIAGEVYESPRGDGKNRFVAELLNRFMSRLNAADEQDDLNQYRRRLLAQGRVGTVCLPGGARRQARLLDVDEEYRLIVEYPDGTRATLSSGEVSVHPERAEDGTERKEQEE